MYELTTAQLLSLSQYLSVTEYIYFPGTTLFSTDLMNTGVRPMELLTINRWQYNNPSNITLNPLKGNNQRTFTESELTDALVFAIQFQIKPYEHLTLRQLESVNKKILPVSQITTTKKSAISYLFRYNYVRQLSVSGMSDTEIAIKMGWSSAVLAASYRATKVYSSSPLPPL